MVKVMVTNSAQAIEVINSVKNANDLTVVIKENTATENSDVSKTKIMLLNSDVTIRADAITLKGSVTRRCYLLNSKST